MATKYLKVGFYKVRITNNPPTTFQAILERFETGAIPDDERRSIALSDKQPVRLQSARRRPGGQWIGEMYRYRMSEELRKGRLDGETSTIELEDDEGLLDTTAFLYDQTSLCLAIHEHKGGVTPKALAYYFQVFGEVARFDLELMLKVDKMERLLRVQPTQFEVQLAGMENANDWRATNDATERLVDTCQYFRGSKMHLTVEVAAKDPNRPTLRNILDAAVGLVQRSETTPDQVRKVRVTGFDPDAPDDPTEGMIDLIVDRLVEFAPVELLSGRKLNDTDCLNAVISAWNKNGERIQAFYAPAALGNA